MPQRIRLDRDHIAFLESGVSIVVASCGDGGGPSLGFAHGCRVLPRGDRVRLFIAEPHCPTLIADIRRSGRIAAVFSRPDSNKTMQLKGVAAEIRALAAADSRSLSGHIEDFIANLAIVGTPPDLVRAVFSIEKGALVAVEFAPNAAFSQTPGPMAGDRLSI
ncbi:MAG TPA: hypothetical protein VEU47_16955 [Candidatus Cybelea sp.]|nr:hypothetical protein [Candidatus Cybelea sp.]